MPDRVQWSQSVMILGEKLPGWNSRGAKEQFQWMNYMMDRIGRGEPNWLISCAPAGSVFRLRRLGYQRRGAAAHRGCAVRNWQPWQGSESAGIPGWSKGAPSASLLK